MKADMGNGIKRIFNNISVRKFKIYFKFSNNREVGIMAITGINNSSYTSYYASNLQEYC